MYSMMLENKTEVRYTEDGKVILSKLIDWAIYSVEFTPKTPKSVFMFINAYSCMTDDEFKRTATLTDS